MKKLIFLLLSIAAVGFAQTNNYVAFASTTKLTLQLPSTGVVPTVSFPDGGRAGATVSCAAAQTATVSWNGTAATTTAGTTLPLPPSVAASAAKVYTAGNVGSGTATAAISVQAGITQGIDLGWLKMGPSGTGNNVTITTTGTCIIEFIWSEKQ